MVPNRRSTVVPVTWAQAAAKVKLDLKARACEARSLAADLENARLEAIDQAIAIERLIAWIDALATPDAVSGTSSDHFRASEG